MDLEAAAAAVDLVVESQAATELHLNPHPHTEHPHLVADSADQVDSEAVVSAAVNLHHPMELHLNHPHLTAHPHPVDTEADLEAAAVDSEAVNHLHLTVLHPDLAQVTALRANHLPVMELHQVDSEAAAVDLEAVDLEVESLLQVTELHQNHLPLMVRPAVLMEHLPQVQADSEIQADLVDLALVDQALVDQDLVDLEVASLPLLMVPHHRATVPRANHRHLMVLHPVDSEVMEVDSVAAAEVVDLEAVNHPPPMVPHLPSPLVLMVLLLALMGRPQVEVAEVEVSSTPATVDMCTKSVLLSMFRCLRWVPIAVLGTGKI